MGSPQTYQAVEDSFSVGPMMLACFALAAIFHADMDDNPLFDTLWMTGLFAGVLAGVPHGIIVILIAHAIHLLLLGDFAVHYIRSMTRKGIPEPVQLDVPFCI